MEVNRGAGVERWIGAVRSPAMRFSKKRYAVCIFKPDRIGDFVLAVGAIRNLTDRFGEENCVLVISPLVRELADLEFPDCQKVEVNPFGNPFSIQSIFHFLRCRWHLGGMGFERLVCLRHQRVRMQNLLLYVIRAKRSFGLANHRDYELGIPWEFSFSNQDAYPSQCTQGTCLELEAHRIVLQRAMGMPLTPQETMPSFRRLEAKPEEYVLVSPFGSMPIRDYPENDLVSVLVDLFRSHSLPVRISFSDQQKEKAERLARRLRSEGVCVVPLNSTSVSEYLDSICHATCVLTVETATAHVATTLNIPTVVLIGGGHYMQYGPWNKSSRQAWLTHPVPCAGCNWECKEPEPYCITRIKTDDVVKALRSVLEGCQGKADRAT